MSSIERELIQGIQQKDRKIFYILYQQYYAALVVFAMKYLKDRESAEDTVQEIFILLWERGGEFNSLEKLIHFLYLSVRNRCINVLKHRSIQQKYDQYCQTISQEEKNIEEEIIQQEILRILWQLIEELPPRCQEVFLLHMDGRKNEEIASALEIAIDTVKNQKKKAIEILRKRMGKLFILFIQAGIYMNDSQ